MHEVNQPRLLPGCRFRLFTPGDGPGKQQSKTPKKTSFFLPFLIRICTNTHYNNTYSCEYALLPKICTLFFRFLSCYWLLKMKTALGPNISPSGLAAGSIIFLLIPTF